MKLDQEQMDAATGLAQKVLHEFVKSEDFTGAIKEATNSAASDAATKIVNQAITSKLKSFGDKLESKVAELIKEAVPVKDNDDDDPDDKKTKGEPDLTKSKAWRDLNKKHDKLTQEVESERAKREAVEVQAFNNERDAALVGLASKGNAIDPENIRDALRADVSRDEDGSLVVKATKDGEEVTQPLKEVVDEYLKARPHSLKASGGGGAGSGAGQGGGAGGGGGEEITPEMLKDPVVYKRLRAEGRISGVKAAPTGS